MLFNVPGCGCIIGVGDGVTVDVGVNVGVPVITLRSTVGGMYHEPH